MRHPRRRLRRDREGSQRGSGALDAHRFELPKSCSAAFCRSSAIVRTSSSLHDISDTRYSAVPRSYEDNRCGRARPGTGHRKTLARVNIGWMSSCRSGDCPRGLRHTNDIEIGSADHGTRSFSRASRLHGRDDANAGGALFSTSAPWAFSRSRAAAAGSFPTVRGDSVTIEVSSRNPPNGGSADRGHCRVIATSTIPWAYASLMAVRPRDKSP